jgi:hypothetical protein
MAKKFKYLFPIFDNSVCTLALNSRRDRNRIVNWEKNSEHSPQRQNLVSMQIEIYIHAKKSIGKKIAH